MKAAITKVYHVAYFVAHGFQSEIQTDMVNISENVMCVVLGFYSTSRRFAQPLLTHGYRIKSRCKPLSKIALLVWAL